MIKSWRHKGPKRFHESGNKSGISPDMALRLSKLMPHSDMALGMNLQRDYDIWIASKHANEIHIVPLDEAA